MSESLPDRSETPFHLGGRDYPLRLRCSYCLEPLGTDYWRPGMRHMNTTGCRGGDVEVYPPEVEQLRAALTMIAETDRPHGDGVWMDAVAREALGR